MSYLQKNKVIIKVLLVIFLLISSINIFGVQQLMGFHGEVKDGGSALSSGDLRVFIYDAASEGNLIYDSDTDYNSAISDGIFDVMLGDGSVELDLNYGTFYYLDMTVDSQDLDFGGSERQQFEASRGPIPASTITAGTFGTGSYTIDTDLTLSGSNAQLNLSQNGDVNADTITANTFSGSGASLTSILASAITAGTFGGSTTYTFPADLIVAGANIGIAADPDLLELLNGELDISGDLLVIGDVFANSISSTPVVFENITVNSSLEGQLNFVAVGGADDTDLAFDLDGTRPRIFSTTDNTIELAEAVIITGTLDVRGGVIEDTQPEDLILRANGVANQLVLKLGGDISIANNLLVDGGIIHINPQASAPGTCTIGDFYVDTSGAYCGCSSANTWENMLGTGTCS